MVLRHSMLYNSRSHAVRQSCDCCTARVLCCGIDGVVQQSHDCFQHADDCCTACCTAVVRKCEWPYNTAVVRMLYNSRATAVQHACCVVVLTVLYSSRATVYSMRTTAVQLLYSMLYSIRTAVVRE